MELYSVHDSKQLENMETMQAQGHQFPGVILMEMAVIFFTEIRGAMLYDLLP